MLFTKNFLFNLFRLDQQSIFNMFQYISFFFLDFLISFLIYEKNQIINRPHAKFLTIIQMKKFFLIFTYWRIVTTLGYIYLMLFPCIRLVKIWIVNCLIKFIKNARNCELFNEKFSNQYLLGFRCKKKIRLQI